MIPHDSNFLTVSDSMDWFENQKNHIEKFRLDIITSIKVGSTERVPLKYFYNSLEEINQDIDKQLIELKLISSFQLISAVEGRLKLHFLDRVKSKSSTNLSKDFRRIFEEHEEELKKLDIEGDIVDIWKKHFPSVSLTDYIGKFRSLMKFRNWIAHGRFIEPNKLGRTINQFDPVLIQRELFLLLNHLKTLPEDFKWI